MVFHTLPEVWFFTLPEVRPVYLEVRRKYLKNFSGICGAPRGMPGVPQGGGNMSKTIPQEAGKSKTVPQEGWKIWGPPVRPLQANHTSGKGEIPKPYLRKGGTEISSPPEVWFEYLEVRRKYLKNPGGMKTIPQEA